jgi:hypothetical protein
MFVICHLLLQTIALEARRVRVDLVWILDIAWSRIVDWTGNRTAHFHSVPGTPYCRSDPGCLQVWKHRLRRSRRSSVSVPLPLSVPVRTSRMTDFFCAHEQHRLDDAGTQQPCFVRNIRCAHNDPKEMNYDAQTRPKPIHNPNLNVLICVCMPKIDSSVDLQRRPRQCR